MIILAFQEILIKKFDSKIKTLPSCLMVQQHDHNFKRLQKIVTKAQNGFAVFYFAGIGSMNFEGKPTIVVLVQSSRSSI